MIRWVYFRERKEVSSGWSSVLPMVAAKQACLGLLLFQFNPQLAKRGEHEMAMASKEASNDWPFSQMLNGSIGKEIHTPTTPNYFDALNLPKSVKRGR